VSDIEGPMPASRKTVASRILLGLIVILIGDGLIVQACQLGREHRGDHRNHCDDDDGSEMLLPSPITPPSHWSAPTWVEWDVRSLIQIKPPAFSKPALLTPSGSHWQPSNLRKQRGVWDFAQRSANSAGPIQASANKPTS
jgi:hypothetical protein